MGATGHEPVPPAAVTRRGNNADLIGTILSLCVHVAIALYVGFTSLFLVMATDACAYQQCGDERWATRGIYVAVGGGIVLVLIDVIITVVLIAKQRIAFYVPLLGCAANIVLALVVVHMASLAGPLK